jgi:hypothetical protein
MPSKKGGVYNIVSISDEYTAKETKIARNTVATVL